MHSRPNSLFKSYSVALWFKFPTNNFVFWMLWLCCCFSYRFLGCEHWRRAIYPKTTTKMYFLAEMFVRMFGSPHGIINSICCNTWLVRRVYFFADPTKATISVWRDQSLNVYYELVDGFYMITFITLLFLWLKYHVQHLKKNQFV